MKKKSNTELNTYEDMLHLPHYVSKKRPQMTISDRAAQFSSFAAVVGHASAVKEAARYTDKRRELDEMGKAIIDEELREIKAQLSKRYDVEVVYFKPDETKVGGKYIVKVGKVKNLDIYKREVQMEDGSKIEIDEIYSILYNPTKSD